MPSQQLDKYVNTLLACGVSMEGRENIPEFLEPISYLSSVDQFIQITRLGHRHNIQINRIFDSFNVLYLAKRFKKIGFSQDDVNSLIRSLERTNTVVM